MSTSPLSFDDVLSAVNAVSVSAAAASAVSVPRKVRRGRKPLGDDLRHHCISVRASDAERKKLDALRGNMPLGEFLREVGLGFKPVPDVPAINKKAWIELSRVGSNLNQITKVLHGTEAAREAMQLLDVLRELRFALHGAKLPSPGEEPVA